MEIKSSINNDLLQIKTSIGKENLLSDAKFNASNLSRDPRQQESSPRLIIKPLEIIKEAEPELDDMMLDSLLVQEISSHLQFLIIKVDQLPEIMVTKLLQEDLS